jgi:hypothetical protein
MKRNQNLPSLSANDGIFLSHLMSSDKVLINGGNKKLQIVLSAFVVFVF